jgi:hypothetical protein
MQNIGGRAYCPHDSRAAKPNFLRPLLRGSEGLTHHKGQSEFFLTDRRFMRHPPQYAYLTHFFRFSAPLI